MSSRYESDDPLVPLRGDRLEEARVAAGLNIRALAQKAGLRQQTVDAMRRPADRGKPKRCRRSNRDNLSEALGLPRVDGSLWLGGEVSHLSDVTRAPSGMVIHELTRSPTGTQLALYHLFNRCRDAWIRDHENTRADEQSVASDDLRARFFVLKESLSQLTQAFWWRGQLLKPHVPKMEFEEEVSDRFREMAADFVTQPFPTDDETAERIEKALIHAMEALLEPWFKGNAELDYDNVLALGNRGWWQRLPSAPSPPQNEERV